MKILKLFSFILILLLTDQALSNEDGKKKNYRKTQSVNFESADVDGLVRSPDGAYVSQKKGLKFMPLYKVEKNFDREIKSSVEYTR